MNYDYNRLTKDVDTLAKNFYLADNFIIGESIMQKSIPCIRIGKGSRRILLAGAFRGTEYLTSAFLVKFASDYIAHIMTKSRLFGYNAARLYEETNIYIVPMVNPDGVDIAINGLDITNPYHRMLISMTGIHSFNLVWQSNARGVDLNSNYSANGKMIIKECVPSKHGGEFPESEPETRAVETLIQRVGFDSLLIFHSQGGEIYYDFDGLVEEKFRENVKKAAQESGYAAYPSSASFGGCKDWFIKEFGKSGFTVEIGLGKNPPPTDTLECIYEENARLTLCAMSQYALKNLGQ